MRRLFYPSSKVYRYDDKFQRYQTNMRLVAYLSWSGHAQDNKLKRKAMKYRKIRDIHDDSLKES